MLASARSGRRANFSRRNRSVLSCGRWYIQDSRPRANMFFARSASFFDRPVPSSAPRVRVAMATGCTAYCSSEPSSRGFAVVPHLGQVALGELVGVDDQHPARGQVADVRLERGRVHGDQHVRAVTRGQDVVVGEVQLERRDPGQGAGGSPDLGREVRQGRQVVAERGGLGGEAISGELHAVARVTGEPDHDPVSLDRRGPSAPVDGGIRSRHSSAFIPSTPVGRHHLVRADRIALLLRG